MSCTSISLYAIVRDQDGRFFGGFNPEKGEPVIVDDIFSAKLFSNKFDIRIRPDEKIVEVTIDLTPQNVTISAPFRPRMKTDR